MSVLSIHPQVIFLIRYCFKSLWSAHTGKGREHRSESDTPTFESYLLALCVSVSVSSFVTC